jgi:hypothetical protein
LCHGEPSLLRAVCSAALVALSCVWVPSAARTEAVAERRRVNRSDTRFAGLGDSRVFYGSLRRCCLEEETKPRWPDGSRRICRRTGFSATASTWLLASHWLGLIVARVTLSPRVERTKAVAVSSFRGRPGAVSVAIFVLVSAHGWLAVMPFVLGCAIALAVPTMLALAGDRYPGNMSALFGLLLTLLQVGGIALPSAIGFISDRRRFAPRSLSDRIQLSARSTPRTRIDAQGSGRILVHF